MDHNRNVLQATTNITENSAGIFSVVSSLPQVNNSETYTLQVENRLAVSISMAQIAGTLREGMSGAGSGRTMTVNGLTSSFPGMNVSASTYFSFSRMPPVLTFHPSIIAAVVCLCFLV